MELFRDDDTRYDATTPRESLYTTVLPSGEEQRSSARVFHEEAFAPPKQVMRTMQASPLRIKTIDSRVEPASSAETNAIRLLRREDELKKAMERHRLEVEQPRRRKLRKSRKSKKPSKKNKFVDEDAETPTVQATSEEFRSAIRRMPETQYMQRVPILTPSAARRHERVHASKTWKRRRMEPADEEVSKSLESFEKKADDEMVTEPPKKRKRTRKTGKSKRTKSITEEMRNERSRERSDEELQQQRQQQEQIQQRQHDDEIVSGHSASGLDELQVMERVSGDDRGAVEAQVPPPAQIQRRPAGEEQQVERRRTAEELGNTAIQIAFETIQEDEEEQKNKEHCAFIENYYPDLTCEKRTEYVAECQKYL
ncbi:unnamed protein product [Heligmosomoides polygyrus]|uniref:aECM cysteine-cradle domain-containing protein n=1 Tax=Heligmosomoides polygyrus TaxID=6339 RepID=A0A183F443_HELPZ|nr:unnamed protein product [Heligmosomoides polygyrus]